MKWLCDGSAINRIARESTNYNVVFERLTALVAASELTFCDGTVDELSRTAEEDPAALWIATVKGQRTDSGAGYQTIRWVTTNCTELVDPEDRYDCPVQVLAHARSLIQDGAAGLQVVTEDFADKPTRVSLAAACRKLSIPAINVEELMEAAKISWP